MSSRSLEHRLRFLKPLRAVYGTIMGARLWAYERGWLASRKVDCPVICIGNLTMGGSGKTPLVIETARLLQEMDCRVAVISRGYKRKGGAKDMRIVSDTRHIVLGPQEAGDEPFLIAESIPGIPVVVGADRFRAGQEACGLFRADAVVMDDGFQHLALKRDLDVLVFDATVPIESLGLFPAGSLREPLTAARRARAAIVSKSNLSPLGGHDVEKAIQNIAPGIETFRAGLIADRVVSIRDDEQQDVTCLRGKRIVSVCAVGNPEAFHRSLIDRYGAMTLERFTFPDHHAYSRHDISRMEMECKRLKGEWLVTTEKDACKIRFAGAGDGMWKVLKARARINQEDLERYKKMLVEVVGSKFYREKQDVVE